MARIPKEEIERLKQAVSIERLAVTRGLELERSGGNLVGPCPFHEEEESGRSLVIRPSTNTWQCRGACQATGSVIDWVMRTEGAAFRHAVELLRGDVPGLEGAEPRPIVKRSTVAKLPAPVDVEAEDDELVAQVLGYYHEQLKASPEAQAYLQQRGLGSSELVTHFRLGFANRTLGYRLPEKNRQLGHEVRGRLQQLGLFRETGHEHFNGSVVVPILDDGKVVEVYGRKVTPRLRPGTAYHTFLHEPPRGIFNAPALAGAPEVILCASVIDALTFWCAGYRHVTALYGTNASAEDHLEAFRRHGTERVLIAYRRDDAGDAAAEALSGRLTGIGVESFRVQFPRGMDANDYALAVQPAAKSLDVVLRSAVWLGKGRTASVPMVGTELGASPAAPALVEPEPVPPPPIIEAPPPPPAATVAPPASSPPSSEAKPPAASDEVLLELGDRRYRIRGLGKNRGPEQLRVNILAGRGDAFFVDTVDLYQARQRANYEKRASLELGIAEEVIKRDLGKVLFRLEEVQEERQRKPEPQIKGVDLSQAELDAALALLRDPNLVDRILDDFDRCGVVGEHINKMVGYLAATSRKLDEPLAVVVQSSSAAGKSSLMDAILALVPDEDRIKYSAMTGQSLFYMGATNLKHKILAIVEEEGAKRASYALKLLQSEGELTIASTAKDPETGNLITREYHVEGPVMIFMTTTAIQIDEELLNRCLVLTVNEDREQTRAIHRLQREAETLEGLVAKKRREGILKLHRNAQRLLRPLHVANPHAPSLSFIDERTRTRRDHKKYLTLIRSIALLHQHQRPIQTVDVDGERIEYIEVTLDDIAIANRLADQVLGRSLDEVPPQTRRFLELVEAWVQRTCAEMHIEAPDFRFSRRDVREVTGLSHEQVRIHLERLVELEYVVVHRGGNGQSFVYELAGSTGSGARAGLGLQQPGTATTQNLQGLQASEGDLQGTCRPASGALQGTYRPPVSYGSLGKKAADRTSGRSGAENTSKGERAERASYTNGEARRHAAESG